MKDLTLILFSLGFALCSFAQNRASTVFFGNLGLDFRTSPPTILSSGMNGQESPASICDRDGNILFYTNGGRNPLSIYNQDGVWSHNNLRMENGLMNDSGGCYSSYMGAVVLPFPRIIGVSTDNLYYILTKGCLESNFAELGYNSGLSYHVVDMSYNNGLGKVVSKYNNIVPYSHQGLQSTSHEPLAAVMHGNDRDYWIFSYTNDSLYSILLNEDGFSNIRTYEPGAGKIMISPSRDFLTAGQRLYRFNSQTADLEYVGSFDNKFVQCAFSSNGTKLYTLENGILSQYWLNAQNIMTSKTFISEIIFLNRLALAPNGIIYLFRTTENKFSGQILCPNQPGSFCNFSMTNFLLNGKSVGNEFTNIPAHYLYRLHDACTVGISEADEPHFQLYPNPSHGLINLVLKTYGSYDVEIYNISSQRIFFKQNVDTNIQIDLREQKSGLYFLRLINKNGGSTVSRFIIE